MTKKKDPKDYLKKGAPTFYTPELAKKICHLISTHPKGLTTIIKMYDLPDRQTIFNWLNEYPDFFDNYMLAKEKQAHVIADETLAVNEEIPTYFDKDGVERIDNGMINRAKIKADALRWNAAILAPKHYNKDREQKASTNMLPELQTRKQNLDEKNKKEY